MEIESLPWIRCTCGKVLAPLYDRFISMTTGSTKISEKDALDALRVTRYCCRTRIIAPIQLPSVEEERQDLIEGLKDIDINPYPRSSVNAFAPGEQPSAKVVKRSGTKEPKEIKISSVSSSVAMPPVISSLIPKKSRTKAALPTIDNEVAPPVPELIGSTSIVAPGESSGISIGSAPSYTPFQTVGRQDNPLPYGTITIGENGERLMSVGAGYYVPILDSRFFKAQ